MFEFFNGERDIRFADFIEGLGYFSLPTDNNVAKTKGIDVICDINGSRKTFNTSILPPLYENIGKPLKINNIYDDNIDVDFLAMEFKNGWLIHRLDFIKNNDGILLDFVSDGYTKKYQYTFMPKK